MKSKVIIILKYFYYNCVLYYFQTTEYLDESKYKELCTLNKFDNKIIPNLETRLSFNPKRVEFGVSYTLYRKLHFLLHYHFFFYDV